MSKSDRILLIVASFAALSSVACSKDGDSDRGLNAITPGVDEIVVDVNRDVRDNLSIYFRGPAARPPAGATIVRFDFNETARELRDGEGLVTGDFLYAAFGSPTRHGSLTVHYTPGGDGWLRTGRYEVQQDRDIASHVFELTVRDAATDVPLSGVLAEARRVDAGHLTNATYTDQLGHLQLQVLPGAFDIEVRQDNYEPVVLRNVSTLGDVLELGEVRMTRLSSKVTIF